MTCRNCRKLERENRKLQEKLGLMERVRDTHVEFIEKAATEHAESMLQIDAMLERVRERIARGGR